MKFSIITATYNAQAYVRDAIESVQTIRARHPDLEHIVVDADSRDETLAIVRSYAAVAVVSEPDRGIYDAFNKGIAAASGDYVVFLNADDRLTAAALDTPLRFLAADPDLDVISGGARFIDRNGAPFARNLTPTTVPHVRGVLFGVPCINARVFRRAVFDRHGGFDPGFALCADRLWLLRASAAGLRAQACAEIFYEYRAHADSQTISGDRAGRRRIFLEHLRLADDIARSDQFAPSIQSIAREWRMIETLKRFLLFPSASTAAAAAAAFRPSALLRAIRSWVFFRGRHSDAIYDRAERGGASRPSANREERKA